MPKYETRTVRKEEAVAFIQNMRWFAGMGRIKTAPTTLQGYVRVTATRQAWSNWVPSSKESAHA